METLCDCIFTKLIVPLEFFISCYICSVCFSSPIVCNVIPYFLTIFILVCFLQPGAFLAGVGGLVFLIHYNDERRAIPKGVLDVQVFNTICACRMLFILFS